MLCRECFYQVFEEEVHRTIVDKELFKRGEKIAIGASGGKGTSPSTPHSILSFTHFLPPAPCLSFPHPYHVQTLPFWLSYYHC